MESPGSTQNLPHSQSLLGYWVNNRKYSLLYVLKKPFYKLGMPWGSPVKKPGTLVIITSLAITLQSSFFLTRSVIIARCELNYWLKRYKRTFHLKESYYGVAVDFMIYFVNFSTTRSPWILEVIAHGILCSRSGDAANNNGYFFFMVLGIYLGFVWSFILNSSQRETLRHAPLKWWGVCCTVLMASEIYIMKNHYFTQYFMCPR